MPAKLTLKLTNQEKEVMADALANFFFDYWQNNANQRDNEVDTLEVGSSRRGGFPAPKVAS